MARERLIAVSRAMTQKRNADCGITRVGSSVMRGMLECPALMVEVIRGLARKHHRPSGHAWLTLAGPGCLKIFSDQVDPFSSLCCAD